MHQHYAEAVGFFGGELAYAAEAGGFEVFFGYAAGHELVADVFGSLDAQGAVAVVGAGGTVGCAGDMHGEVLLFGDACNLVEVGQLGVVHKFGGVELEVEIDGYAYGYP